MTQGTWSRRAALTGGIASLMIPVSLRAQTGPPTSAPGPPAPSEDRSAYAELKARADAAERLTVPVRIDGQGPFAFLVDTCATTSLLSTELAQRLALPSAAPVLVSSAVGEVSAPGFRVERLEVGARTLLAGNLPSFPGANIGADGLLGIDSLAGQELTIDYRKLSMRLAPARRWNDFRDIVFKARSRLGNLLLIEGWVDRLRDADAFDREPVTVILDTGASHSIGNPALLRRMLKSPIALQSWEVDVVSITGQSVPGRWSRLPSVHVGALKLTNVPVVFADLHNFQVWSLDNQPALLLGVDMLRLFPAVQIDFLHKEVSFRLPRPA